MNTYIRQFMKMSVLLLISTSVSAEKIDASSFECAFSVGSAKQSQRNFVLSKDVYRCLRHSNYSDMALVNGQGRAVWFRLTKTPDQIEHRKHSKELEFYSETSKAAFKTAAQIRRIGKLTGVISGQESEDQWRHKNAFYSSYIIDQKLDENLKSTNQSNTLNSITIKTDIPLLAGGRFRSDDVLVMIEASTDLRTWRSVIEPTVLSILSRESGTTPQIIKIPHQRSQRYLRIASMSHFNNFMGDGTTVSAEYLETNRQSPALNWMHTDTGKWNEELKLWELELPYLIPVSAIRFTHTNDIVFYQGRFQYLRYINPYLNNKKDSIPVESGKDKLKRIAKKTLRKKHKRSPYSDWRRLGVFNQYQLIIEDGLLKSPEITAPRVFSKKWGFSFDHPQDITQLELPSVEFAWHPQQLVFAAQGKGPFTLLVGRDEPVSWQNLPVLPNLLESDGEEVSLVKVDSPDNLTSSDLDGTDKNSDNDVSVKNPDSWFKYALILLLGIAVLLLGYMAYRLSKSMNT